jgi:addiction module RelB/DinJ family antitoxin
MTTTTKTMINVKIDSKLKKQAQEMAKSFGLPLSTIVSRKLEEFVDDGRLVFEKPLIPNAKTAKLIDESRKNYIEGKMEKFSGPFKGVDEAIAHLKSL